MTLSFETLSRRPEAQTRDAATYPSHPTLIPEGTLRAGRYALRFARDARDLQEVQRLRFEVFNRELDEGLAASWQSGLDVDEYDARCHHLMVLYPKTGEVVGTYRLMTGTMASAEGFYSEGEYDLSTLPLEVKAEAVEVGRACVRSEHRNGRVVHLLWRGLARYMDWNRCRYLFGCCSVPTLDAEAVYRLDGWLEREGHRHDALEVKALPALRRPAPSALTPREDDGESMPPLFGSYLKLGARAISGPAFDEAFGVTDFLVLLDLEAMDARVRQSFMGRGTWLA